MDEASGLTRPYRSTGLHRNFPYRTASDDYEHAFFHHADDRQRVQERTCDYYHCVSQLLNRDILLRLPSVMPRSFAFLGNPRNVSRSAGPYILSTCPGSSHFIRPRPPRCSSRLGRSSRISLSRLKRHARSARWTSKGASRAVHAAVVIPDCIAVLLRLFHAL